jgi:hypothetical protein
VRCGLSSVYGFRRGLELGVLGDGGSGWLKSVSLAQKLIIIESACARGDSSMTTIALPSLAAVSLMTINELFE